METRSADSAAAEKTRIRKLLLERRKNLPRSAVLSASRSIAGLLSSEEVFADSSRVALYFPANGEVDTLEIFRKCLELGKKVFFPRTQGSRLVFLRTKSLDELSPSSFGIPQPPEGAESAGYGELDLVLVPGVAFDPSGNRIGYGKGFYDRFLKDISRRLTFALAYQFQVLNSIPSLETDVSVGGIITENGAIDCLGKEED